MVIHLEMAERVGALKCRRAICHVILIHLFHWIASLAVNISNQFIDRMESNCIASQIILHNHNGIGAFKRVSNINYFDLLNSFARYINETCSTKRSFPFWWIFTAIFDQLTSQNIYYSAQSRLSNEQFELPTASKCSANFRYMPQRWWFTRQNPSFLPFCHGA